MTGKTAEAKMVQPHDIHALRVTFNQQDGHNGGCMDCRKAEGCTGRCDDNDTNGDGDFFPEQ